MTQQELSRWIQELIKEDKLYKFYKSKEWRKLKQDILTEHHSECVWCKKKGVISKAVTVHHAQYVRKHPHLALSRTYTHKGKTYDNLIPLCHDCHDKAHDRMRYKSKAKTINKERW